MVQGAEQRQNPMRPRCLELLGQKFTGEVKTTQSKILDICRIYIRIQHSNNQRMHVRKLTKARKNKTIQKT